MGEGVHLVLLHLLILFSVLCQGTISTLSSDNNIQESSVHLAREKRVVNYEDASGQRPVLIEELNYMVMLNEEQKFKCAAVILSHYTIITAAKCVRNHESKYNINAGSGYAHHSSNHNITSKAVHYGDPPYEPDDGIALLTVNPPLIFDLKIGSIQLYTGPLTAGTQVTISGWGCVYPLLISREQQLTRRLRRITVPVMNTRECENVYQGHFPISYKNICTYHEQKFCARNDLGAPLVVDNRLAGIHVYKGEFSHHINPDVFIDLQLPQYRGWINQNTLRM